MKANLSNKQSVVRVSKKSIRENIFTRVNRTQFTSDTKTYVYSGNDYIGEVVYNTFNNDFTINGEYKGKCYAKKGMIDLIYNICERVRHDRMIENNY